MRTHRTRNHSCELCCEHEVTPWKLDTESEAPSATTFRSGWHNLIQLSELINEKMHTEDGPPLRGRSDEHFWHLKRYNTAATKTATMHCSAAVQADRGNGRTRREELQILSRPWCRRSMLREGDITFIGAPRSEYRRTSH